MTRYSYDLVQVADDSGERLKTLINDYARQGWRLTSMHSDGVRSPRNALLVFEIVPLTRIQRAINLWFWSGAAGILIAPLLAAAAFLAGNTSLFLTFGALSLAGWPAVLVGVVGKGVELGMRAASNE